jgi:hypothetical protein
LLGVSLFKVFSFLNPAMSTPVQGEWEPLTLPAIIRRYVSVDAKA